MQNPRIATIVANRIGSSNSKYATPIKEAKASTLTYALSRALYSGTVMKMPFTKAASKAGKIILPNDFDKGMKKETANIYKVRVGTILLNAFHEEKLIKIERGFDKKKPKSRLPYGITAVNTDWVNEVIRRGTILTANWEGQADEIQFTKPDHYTSFWHPLGGAMVRNINPEVEAGINPKDCPELFESVNKVMDTVYQINVPVLKTVLHYINHPIMTLEDMRMDDDQKASNHRQIVATLQRAIAAKHRKFWHLPFLDSRYRVYSSSIFLAATGSKLSRALHYSAVGAPITEQAVQDILIHTANCWGYDGVTNAKRLAYAQEKEASWVACGENPIKNDLWTKADSPYEFLACVIELAKISKGAKKTYLFVAKDQSNSGSQHLNGLSGMNRPEEAALCNLVASEEKGDTYLSVADAVHDKIEIADPDNDLYDEITPKLVKLDRAVAKAKKAKDDPKAGKKEKMRYKRAVKARTAYWTKNFSTICSLAPVFWDRMKDKRRATSKRSVLCFSYSITATGMSKHLMTDHGHKPAYEGINTAYCDWLGRKLYKSCTEVLKTNYELMQLMTYIGIEEWKAGRQLRYTSPIGAPVMQNYFTDTTKQIEVWIGGKKVKLRVAVGERNKKDYKRIKQSSAVNYVHSCDASHLHMVRNAFDGPMLLVHDSFAVLPGRAKELDRITRDTFIEMHSRDLLVELLNETGYSGLYDFTNNMIDFISKNEFIRDENGKTAKFYKGKRLSQDLAKLAIDLGDKNKKLDALETLSKLPEAIQTAVKKSKSKGKQITITLGDKDFSGIKSNDFFCS